MESSYYRQQMAQYHLSIYSASKALGSLISCWYSTVLMEYYGNRGIFIFASIIPLCIMVVCVLFFDEIKVSCILLYFNN